MTSVPAMEGFADAEGVVWNALLEGSELHPYAQAEAKIAVLGQDPVGFGLGILQVIPDKRDVQV